MGPTGKLTAGALAAFLLSAGTALGCPFGNSAEEIRNGKMSLYWLPVGEIRVSEPFDLEICLTVSGATPEGGVLEVDAVMPAHGHGMNYRSEVQLLEPGHFIAEGMLFHMPGKWEIRFDFVRESGKTTFVSRVDLQ